MEHIDSLICLDSEVRFVSHQKLDQLNITMERCEVQRIEPLLGLRRCIDPIGHVVTHLLLYIVQYFGAQLLCIRFAIALHLLIFEELCQALLVVGDQELADPEGVIVSGPMQQIMTIFIDYLRYSE